jgi:hypothetical protein
MALDVACSRTIARPHVEAHTNSFDAEPSPAAASTVSTWMQAVRVIGRILVIAVGAHLAAAAAGMALVASETAQAWIASGFSSHLGLSQVLSEMLGIGRVTAECLGAFGAVLALPILWRTQLRKSVPLTSVATVAAAAMSRLVPFASDFDLTASAFSILITLGAGFLTMCVCACRWPRESAPQPDAPSPPQLPPPVQEFSQAAFGK